MSVFIDTLRTFVVDSFVHICKCIIIIKIYTKTSNITDIFIFINKPNEIKGCKRSQQIESTRSSKVESMYFPL